MIVVCPNCHVLLDNRAIKLNKEELELRQPHFIDDEYIDYHNKEINIIQMVDNLPSPELNIKNGDIKELYYEDRKEKYGF